MSYEDRKYKPPQIESSSSSNTGELDLINNTSFEYTNQPSQHRINMLQHVDPIEDIPSHYSIHHHHHQRHPHPTDHLPHHHHHHHHHSTSATSLQSSSSSTSSTSHHPHHHSHHLHLQDQDRIHASTPSTSQISSQQLLYRGLENGSASLTVRSMDTDDRPRAKLVIIEEPTNRIRYRYKSEKGSHGGLTGENSCQNRKTYPTVKLENYHSSSQVFIKASLYTNESTPRLHVHKLMGKHCLEDGSCILHLPDNNQAVFQNIGILFVGKKEVPDILYQRKLNNFTPRDGSQLTDEAKERLREEADKEAKGINLNSVKICFQAFDQNQAIDFMICNPVFSRPIANQKSPDSGELKIVRMDKYAGLCTGDDEVFLLCEKVNKKEIKIRFFELDTKNSNNQIWEAFAHFNESDVHHQVCIVFRTPAYRDTNITRSVQVFVQLYRPKDKEYSEPKPFMYKPCHDEEEDVDRKRKKAPDYSPASDVIQFPTFTENGQYLIPSTVAIDSQCQPNTSAQSEAMNFYGNN